MTKLITVRDQMLLPPLEGSSKHHMFLQKNEFSHLMLHQRVIGRELRTCVTEKEHNESPSTSVMIEAAIYGGLLFHNYGHFIAETVHRLWPSWSGEIKDKRPFLFHAVPAGQEGDVVKPFMIDVLSYFGIGRDDIVIIDQPIICGELILPDQAKLWGRRAPPSYNEALSRLEGGDAWYDNVYVSRSRHLHTGSYLGEWLVEEHLKQNDFKIIHPEDWSLKDLVGIYRKSKNVIFSEGSPIHVIELTGGTDANVFIICRRSKKFALTNFVDSIAPLCQNVYLFSNKATLTSLQWDFHKSQPSNSLASALVDLRLLIEEIAGFCKMNIPDVSEALVAEAVNRDLLKLIFHERVNRIPDDLLGRMLKMLSKQVKAHGIIA